MFMETPHSIQAFEKPVIARDRIGIHDHFPYVEEHDSYGLMPLMVKTHGMETREQYLFCLPLESAPYTKL